MNDEIKTIFLHIIERIEELELLNIDATVLRKISLVKIGFNPEPIKGWRKELHKELIEKQNEKRKDLKLPIKQEFIEKNLEDL